MKLPITGPYTAKDQIKSDLATKFIGRGSAKSSTAKYAQAWGKLANCGTYHALDTIFVSAEGNRIGRIPIDTAEIMLAIKADAFFATDKAHDRDRAYNIGEREVVALLTSQGYIEVSPGLWCTP